MKIGFIGQGWIGKNYADNYESRGYETIRYSQENPYIQNKDKIKDCDIVFIAVPTPTTEEGFDYSIVDEVLNLLGKGKTAIIKSTILPGTTNKLQANHPDIYVCHSPEFLTEATAKYDAWYPDRNIVGYSNKEGADEKAEQAIETMPQATYQAVVPAEEAEMVKYAGNCWFYFKVMYVNILYDLCKAMGVNYEIVKKMMKYDTRIGSTHLDPVHQDGRGAGGHCFIKDFSAFAGLYSDILKEDKVGIKILKSLEEKNIELLSSSGKSLDLLKGVYGELIK